MSSGSKKPAPPSGEQLRAAFDVAFGAAAIPVLHENAFWIGGPHGTPTLFDSTAEMVLEALRLTPAVQPVESQHGNLYGQLAAKLKPLLEWWHAWIHEPTDQPTEEIEKATQRDLFHAFGDSDLDSFPQRRELVTTCRDMAGLLREHPASEYQGACQLGAAAGSLLEGLVGGRDGEFAREVGHRGRVLAELATVLGAEVAEAVKKATNDCVAAFREEHWRRDGEDVFWSDVVLALRHELVVGGARRQGLGGAWPAARSEPSAADLLVQLAPSDPALLVTVAELSKAFDANKSTIHKWVKKKGFPAPRNGKVRYQDAAKWATANNKRMDLEAIPMIAELVEKLRAEIREQKEQADVDDYGKKHDDGALSE